MNSQANISGYLLALAGSTFWFSWFLMPDGGTLAGADTWKIVDHARDSVYYSSVIQIISSILYISALFLLANLYGSARKMVLVGIILFGIGSMGMCADAFFHLLSYCMTDEKVPNENAMMILMNLVQREGTPALMPLLLSFFIGSLLLVMGLHKQGVISKIPFFLNVTALCLIPVSIVVASIWYLPGNDLIWLSMLGLVATSHTFLGSELIISIENDEDLISDVAKAQTEVQR